MNVGIVRVTSSFISRHCLLEVRRKGGRGGGKRVYLYLIFYIKKIYIFFSSPHCSVEVPNAKIYNNNSNFMKMVERE